MGRIEDKSTREFFNTTNCSHGSSTGTDDIYNEQAVTSPGSAMTNYIIFTILLVVERLSENFGRNTSVDDTSMKFSP